MTTYRLVTQTLADLDIDAALTWYDNERPGLGAALLAQLRAAFERILSGPLGYPVVGFGVRRALLRRFPYAVYFVVEDDVIVVIAVVHTSRHSSVWQQRRN